MLTINSIDSKLAITRKNNLEIQQKTWAELKALREAKCKL